LIRRKKKSKAYASLSLSLVNETISETEKIQLYQQLIDQLPHAHQYLLFYLLDLLSLFSHHAKYTKMNSASLASVFTPGILLNPEYVMDPSHYRTSQRVVQFLIEHQEYFHLPSINVEKRRLTPTQYHQQYHQQSNEEKHLLRANTVPVKKPRFGVNDPLQIVNVKV
jgi:hypothetical protein